jgi:hypothetical protein
MREAWIAAAPVTACKMLVILTRGAPPALLLCAPEGPCRWFSWAFIDGLSSPQIPPCAPAPFSAINTKPRADVWLAGRIILQLSSLSGIYMFRKVIRPSKSVPATGLRFGNKTLPKGSFKQGPPNVGSFLNF